MNKLLFSLDDENYITSLKTVLVSFKENERFGIEKQNNIYIIDYRSKNACNREHFDECIKNFIEDLRNYTNNQSVYQYDFMSRSEIRSIFVKNIYKPNVNVALIIKLIKLLDNKIYLLEKAVLHAMSPPNLENVLSFISHGVLYTKEYTSYYRDNPFNPLFFVTKNRPFFSFTEAIKEVAKKFSDNKDEIKEALIKHFNGSEFEISDKEMVEAYKKIFNDYEVEKFMLAIHRPMFEPVLSNKVSPAILTFYLTTTSWLSSMSPESLKPIVEKLNSINKIGSKIYIVEEREDVILIGVETTSLIELNHVKNIFSFMSQIKYEVQEDKDHNILSKIILKANLEQSLSRSKESKHSSKI